MLSPLAMFRVELLPILATMLIMFSMVGFVDAGAILGERFRDKPNIHSRSLAVENQSHRKVDMFWVNTFKSPEEFVPQFVDDGEVVGCPYGATKSISSYTGHAFEIREIPSSKTGSCLFDFCRKVRYKVTARNDQKITINPDFTLTVEDDHEHVYSKADDMFTRCQKKLVNGISPFESIKIISKCMEGEVVVKVKTDEEEQSFHNEVHRHMADELVPYNCASINKTESFAMKNETWNYKDEGDKEYIMRKLHQVPTSEIFVVDNFVTEEVCDALKIYRHEYRKGNNVGVPVESLLEKTKQGELLLDTYYKIYAMLMDNYENWKELDFRDEMVYEYFKDPVGFSTPAKLCTTQDEVDEVIEAIETGKPKTCLVPGGVLESAHTKRVVVEDGVPDEEKDKKRLLAQLFLFCDEPKDKLGGLHFPYAAVHTVPKVGKLVVAVHRHQNVKNHKLDGYVNEYHLCPNHEVYVHSVFDHDPPPVGITDDGKGEL